MGATGVALGVHEQGAGGGDAAVAAAAAAAATEPKKVSHVPLFLGAEDSAGALSTSVSKLGNVMPALLRSNILCMSRQDSTFTSTVISEFFSMRMHAHVCVCVCVRLSLPPSLPPLFLWADVRSNVDAISYFAKKQRHPNNAAVVGCISSTIPALRCTFTFCNCAGWIQFGTIMTHQYDGCSDGAQRRIRDLRS